MGNLIFYISMIFYLEINTAHILDWKPLSEQSINADAYHSSDETRMSQGLTHFIGDRHEYSEIINKPNGLVHDKLCFCSDTDTGHKTFYDDFKEQTLNRETPFNDNNLLFYNDKLKAIEANQDVPLSKDKQLSKERNNPTSSDSTSSQDELLSEPFHSGQGRKSRICIERRDAYEDCKVACRDACEIKCAKYGCVRKLYKKIRSECKDSCKKKFRKP